MYFNTAYAAHYILCFSLTKGLRSKCCTLLSIPAVHQPFYISICIWKLPTRTVHFIFLSDKGPTFKTLDFTFYTGSTSTFLYFNLYLNNTYPAHYIICFSLTKAYVQNVRLRFLYRQYTNLFIFRIVSENCLRSTLRCLFRKYICYLSNWMLKPG